MTRPKPMTLERLRELLDAYGADTARMPEAEREAVSALIASDTAAMELVARARSLDVLLDAAPIDAVSPGLRARVAEIPVRHPRADVDPWSTWLSWRGALRFALAGLVAGAIGVASVTLSIDESSLVASDDGWDDVTAIAFATGIEEQP